MAANSWEPHSLTFLILRAIPWRHDATKPRLAGSPTAEVFIRGAKMGLSVVVVLACFCTAAVGSVIACTPVRQDVSAVPFCHPVGEQEESCNSDIPFLYDNKKIECFGDGINRVLIYEIASESFTATGTVGYCPQSSHSTSFGNCITPSGTMGSTNLSITYSFSPINLVYYNITVRISLPDSSNAHVGAYGIQLTTKQNGASCVCINSSFTNEHSFILQYKKNEGPITIKADTFPRTLTSPAVKERILPPSDCADYERIPYDKETCGLPQYEKPRNVRLRCNATHTNISWDTPYYRAPGELNPTHHSEPDLDTYYLTVITCNGQKNYFTIRNSTEVTLNTSKNFDFILYGYSPCSGLFDYHNGTLSGVVGCSLPAMCADTSQDSEAPCCVALPCPTPIPTPTRGSSNGPGNEHPVVYYIAGSAVGFILIVIITIVLCIIGCYKTQHTPISVTYGPLGTKSPSPCACSALVMYSLNSPELEKCTIAQHLGPDLQGIESFLLDTRLPKQTVVDWITERYEQANAVFCVCNKEFSDDWESDSTGVHCSDSAIAIRTLRKLFEGDIVAGTKTPRRYAVVLTKPTDENFIPSILRGLPRFIMSDSPALAKFAGLRVTSPV